MNGGRMRRRFCVAATAALLVSGAIGTGVAQAAAPGVSVSALTTFPANEAPSSVAATNQGDVTALAGTNIVRVGPQGQQRLLGTYTGGAFGEAIGIAYGANHQLYAANPESFGPPAEGTILRILPNGTTATVPGSNGMVAPDGFGLDSATGYTYATDIYGNAIWRISPSGVAEPWTSVTTNPLLVLPDGVKVFDGAVYTSIESGKVLRIPINPDGSAGTATVWAQVPGPAFFDDMVLDDRTGDVYVSRLDTNELLQITPSGLITPIATHADGLLGAANMALIHIGQSTVIYDANTNDDFLGTGAIGGAGPAILKITIPSPSQ